MTPARAPEAASRPAGGGVVVPVAALAAAGVVALGITRLATRETPGRMLLLAVALAAGSALFVAAIARPVAVTAVAFALLAYVRREPAPVDLVLLLLVAAVGSSRRLPIRLPAPIGLVLALLAATGVVSCVNANDPARAFQFLATTVFLLGVGVGVRMLAEVPNAIERAFAAYVAAASLTAALGVVALFIHFPGSRQLLYDPHRVMAFFKDPNVFGPFLVPAAVVLLDRIVRGDGSRGGKRVIELVQLAALLAGIVFAFSRAAWLNLVLAVAAVVAMHAVRRGGARTAGRAIALFGGGVGAAYLLLRLTGSLSFLQQRSHLESYDQNRFSNQITALHDATHHVFGFGPGQAEVNLPLSTHSTYARVAYEQGLVGVVLLVVLLLATLAVAVRLASARETVWGIGTAPLLGAWLGLIANSAFIDTLHWRHLWVLAGLLWAGAMQTRDERRPTAALLPAR